MKGYKKLLFGEKMPDKDDPAYVERYKKEVEAGKKFARKLRIDKVAANIQKFAVLHKTAFVISVFGFILLCLSLNIYRLVLVYNSTEQKKTATQCQEEMLKKRHDSIARRLSNTTYKLNKYSYGNIPED